MCRIIFHFFLFYDAEMHEILWHRKVRLWGCFGLDVKKFSRLIHKYKYFEKPNKIFIIEPTSYSDAMLLYMFFDSSLPTCPTHFWIIRVVSVNLIFTRIYFNEVFALFILVKAHRIYRKFMDQNRCCQSYKHPTEICQQINFCFLRKSIIKISNFKSADQHQTLHKFSFSCCGQDFETENFIRTNFCRNYYFLSGQDGQPFNENQNLNGFSVDNVF